MISFLQGTVEHVGEKSVIINAGSIGYAVIVSPKIVPILAKSKTSVKLFVHSQMNMREGTFDLYGFTKKEDLELFKTLTTVSGIGSKSAMNIMSSVEPQHLKTAVMNEDANYLKKVSGLGPKIAQRLVMELQNKLDYLDVGDGKTLDLGQETQALEALLSLGYNQSQALEALKEVKGATLSDRVREALKLLGRK